MSALSSAGNPLQAPSRRSDQYALVLIVIAVAASAWILLALSHGDGHSGATPPAVAPEVHGEHTAGAHSHHAAPTADPGVSAIGAHATQAVTGWALMVVAMMLPPALPLLQTVRKLVANRPMAPMLTSLSAGAFVAAWTVVGVVLVTAYFLIQGLAGNALTPTSSVWVAGAVIVFAGIYQFTPLKDLCLRGCRSPRSFVLAHWQGRRTAATEILCLTGAYAASCIGCCWALMLICFAVGAAALPVMVALTVVMAAERLVSWGQRLVRPTGIILIGLGTAMLAGPALSGLSIL